LKCKIHRKSPAEELVALRLMIVDPAQAEVQWNDQQVTSLRASICALGAADPSAGEAGDAINR
jgi:hypothetical protein